MSNGKNVTKFDRRTDAPGRCKRYEKLEQFEADLADVVPVLGVACETAAQLRARWMSREAYIGSRDSNGFIAEVGFLLALAAVQRGHQPAVAMEMGRVASTEIQRRYKGSHIYFPVQADYDARDAWIQAVYCPVNAEMVRRATGLSHRQMRHIRAAAVKGRTTRDRRAG